MKYRIHRDLAERIREGCEAKQNVCIDPRWFSWGSVYPDCTHHRLWHMHRVDAAGGMVGRMVRRFCRRALPPGGRLSRWRSLRLGIIIHYVCDFSCYVHTPAYAGSLKEHRAYEQAQAALPPAEFPTVSQAGERPDLHGARDAAEAYALLLKALDAREAGSFSPAEDLDYALAAGTELAAAMLRLCTEGSVPLPLRYRLPLLRRRAYGA